MIRTQIKQDYLTARKQKNVVATSILSTLLGDLETKEKQGITIDDIAVVALVKKFLESITLTEENAGVTDVSTAERATLMVYLPKQLNIDDIRSILSNAGISDRGQAQKYMKQNYVGQYNGADVNKALL